MKKIISGLALSLVSLISFSASAQETCPQGYGKTAVKYIDAGTTNFPQYYPETCKLNTCRKISELKVVTEQFNWSYGATVFPIHIPVAGYVAFRTTPPVNVCGTNIQDGF